MPNERVSNSLALVLRHFRLDWKLVILSSRRPFPKSEFLMTNQTPIPNDQVPCRTRFEFRHFLLD
jgi:hypothetical protein